MPVPASLSRVKWGRGAIWGVVSPYSGRRCMMEKFAELIEKGAQQLGMTTQYLWPKAVLYTWAGAWATLIGYIFVAVVIAGLMRRVRRSITANYANDVQAIFVAITTAVWV